MSVKKVVSVESPKYQLNAVDGKKILKGCGIAAGGSVAMYLLNLLPQVDFGTYAYVVVPIASVMLNTLLKFFSE